MRFEIGPGGGLVILLAVLVLSASVFFLGIISGHEIVRGERNQSHVVSIYPLPTGGPSASSPQATNSPAPVSRTTPRPSAATIAIRRSAVAGSMTLKYRSGLTPGRPAASVLAGPARAKAGNDEVAETRATRPTAVSAKAGARAAARSGPVPAWARPAASSAAQVERRPP